MMGLEEKMNDSFLLNFLCYTVKQKHKLRVCKMKSFAYILKHEISLNYLEPPKSIYNHN